MPLDLDLLLLRWAHLLAAMAAVGGMLFMRLALLPSVAALSDDARKTLHDGVRARWAKVVMIAIAVLIGTGLYNFMMVIVPQIKAELPAIKGVYHAVFATKFLLALVMFFISSALVGRSPVFQKIRDNARFWLTLNLALALIIVGMSNGLRLMRDKAIRERGASPPAVTALER